MSLEDTINKMNDMLFLQLNSDDETLDEFVDVALGFSFHVSESHGAKGNDFSKQACDTDIKKNGHAASASEVPLRMLHSCISDAHRMVFEG